MHFTCSQIFAIDSAVVKTQQKLFSSHGGFLTYAIYHLEKQPNQIKLTHYDVKRGHDSDSQSK